MARGDEKLQRIMDLTGADRGRAERALASAKGDVAAAVAVALKGEAEEQKPSPARAPAATKPQAPAPGSPQDTMNFLAGLVVLAMIGFLGWRLIAGDDDPAPAREPEIAAPEWSSAVIEAAERYAALGSYPPSELSDAELRERLGACQSLIQQATSADYIHPVDFPDEHWDGSLGTEAMITDAAAIRDTEERIEAFRGGSPFDEEFLVFALVDSFSGPQRTFRRAECETGHKSVSVQVCSTQTLWCDTKTIPAP